MGPNRGSISLRRRELARSAELLARLTYYPPGFAQADHAHDTDQYSLLLLGGFVETARREDREVTNPCAGFKAAGQRHRNAFGGNGALILAIDMQPKSEVPAPWRWRPLRREPAVAALVRALISGESGGFAEDLAGEMAALLFGSADDAPEAAKTAPWLKRVCAHIEQEPESARLDVLAAEAGVHPTHLSRAFASVYGAPLSVYRRRSMAMKAAGLIVRSAASLASIAAMTGFSDQAHMTRVLRAEVGGTPARLARLFA